MYATRSLQIGLAFRTRPTAPPQACTLIGAAAMPEIDGNRQHTMVQSRQAPARRPPTSGRVPLVDAGRNWSSKIPCFGSRRGLPLSIKVATVRSAGLLFRGEWVHPALAWLFGIGVGRPRLGLVLVVPATTARVRGVLHYCMAKKMAAKSTEPEAASTRPRVPLPRVCMLIGQRSLG